MNKLVLVLFIVFVGVMGINVSAAAPGRTPPPSTPLAGTPLVSTPVPAQRTAVPTWTLPFVVSPTPEPTRGSELPEGMAPGKQLPTATPVPPTPTPLPRLVIPELEVDQSIIPVLIVDGTWDMEPLEEQVGWLTTTGAEPGADLAMTLAGHVNISLGHPGPFLNLKKLKTGDEVIYRAGGLDYVYAVQTQEKVKPDAVDELYVADGTQLLLVTCSDWSYFWSQYAQRLIVTTKLINTIPSP